MWLWEHNVLSQVRKAFLTGQSWLRADINLRCDGEQTHEEMGVVGDPQMLCMFLLDWWEQTDFSTFAKKSSTCRFSLCASHRETKQLEPEEPLGYVSVLISGLAALRKCRHYFT